MFAPMMEITTKIGCRLQCRFCPQQLLIAAYYHKKNIPESVDLQGMMSFETFQTCVDKIPPNIDIHFSGMCEPWLNPQCSKMLLYSAEKGHRVHVFTSLCGMSLTDYHIIKKVCPATFVLHIPDEEGNSAFEIDRAYLELLNTIISDVIDGTFRIDSFSCHGSVHSAIKNLVAASKIRVNSTLNNRAGNVPEDVGLMPIPELHGSITCRWCGGTTLDKNVLLPNGTVLLCCMDYSMAFPLGNLTEQSYQEISEGSCKQQYQKMMEDEVHGRIICRTCSRARKTDSEL